MTFEELYTEYRQQFRTLEDGLPNPDCIYPENDKRWHRYPEWNWDIFYDTPLMDSLEDLVIKGYEVAVPSATWSALRKGKVAIRNLPKAEAGHFVQRVLDWFGPEIRKIEIQKRATYIWFDMRVMREKRIKLLSD